MGKFQDDFLSKFKGAFENRFPHVRPEWKGGQSSDNKAKLPPQKDLRRKGKIESGELFELGDLRADIGDQTLVIEYDKDALFLPNLLKYWPYIKGEMECTGGIKPKYPLVIGHFSNWDSYPVYRDLWDWVMRKIKDDSKLICGRQFDNGGEDVEIWDSEIRRALDFIGEQFHLQPN